jgi:hypothetical protein
MIARGAPEEPDLALIGRPQLAEPPERLVVIAFRAADCDRGKRPGLLVLLDDYDLSLASQRRFLQLVLLDDPADIPALPALQLPCRRDHEALALRTEHVLSNGHANEIKLRIGSPDAGNMRPFRLR